MDSSVHAHQVLHLQDHLRGFNAVVTGLMRGWDNGRWYMAYILEKNLWVFHLHNFRESGPIRLVVIGGLTVRKRSIL
jgi:hypothetical protein